MNILIVNWTWYPSGGDWTAVNNLIKIYEKNGHRIIPFSMQDERNNKTEFDKYFVTNIDYKELNKNKNIFNAFRVLNRSIYSLEAERNLKKLFKNIKIDLAHLHNYGHYITPSILPVLKRQNIPVIWTLHDFSLICPAVSFVSNGKICESCKGRKFYNCTIKKCKKNSYMASLMASLQAYIYNIWNIDKYINFYITPSEFLKQKFIEFGFDGRKLLKIYNPYDIMELNNIADSTAFKYKNYILYLGRLELIKGVLTLISSMKFIFDTPLLIIGNGTEENYFKNYVDINQIKNVFFLGKLNREDVLHYIKHSLFTICPSECYENLPYSIIEAMALGKPVIGANIGGIPELVIDGYTGLLFEPGNIESLSEKIKTLLNDNSRIISYGLNAKKFISEMVDPDTHYKKLNNIFYQLRLLK